VLNIARLVAFTLQGLIDHLLARAPIPPTTMASAVTFSSPHASMATSTHHGASPSSFIRGEIETAPQRRVCVGGVGDEFKMSISYH
jgi:hypothetical protein